MSDKKHNTRPDESLLRELLVGVDNDKERLNIRRAWAALEPLEESVEAPRPGGELGRLFQGDRRMSDQELSLLAAAGECAAPAQDGNPVGEVRERVANRDDDARSPMAEEPCEDGLESGALPEGANHEKMNPDEHEPDLDRPRHSLCGTDGAEVFLVEGGEERQVISGFRLGTDQLVFAGLTGTDQLTLRFDGRDTAIRYQDTVVVLEGVELAQEDVPVVIRPGDRAD